MKRKHIKEKELYYEYAEGLFKICIRYLNNKETAEEILNDAFIKIFKNLSAFKPHSSKSLFFWMKKIIINECLMHIRKTNHPRFIEINDWDAPEELSLDCEYKDLCKIFDLLPIGYRTVFNMYVIDNFSHKEIAEKLGITESTSRSQLTMARKQLKKHLKTFGYVG